MLEAQHAFELRNAIVCKAALAESVSERFEVPSKSGIPRWRAPPLAPVRVASANS